MNRRESKIKTNINEKIVVYKAPLVAKDFKHVYCIVYDETSSPVTIFTLVEKP